MPCTQSRVGQLTVVIVSEHCSGTKDGRPGLSDDLGARRDVDGVRNEVNTRIKEDDLAARELRGGHQL